jgi:hypothetical protein
MLNRIVLLLVVVSMLFLVPGGARADVGSIDDRDYNLEGPIVIFCAAGMCGSLFLTMYNSSRLEADNPSRGGGAAGLVVGSFATLGGAAALAYPHPAARAAGAACLAVGVYTVYTGVKSLGAVRRKFIEEEERTLTLQPILIDDGSGRLGPGLQASWTF